MNQIKQLRTEQINNFMSLFDDLRYVTADQIEEGLRSILGEKPGVEFEYGVDHVLNEATGKNERREELRKISVFYSYFDDEAKNVKVGKISYVVG